METYNQKLIKVLVFCNIIAFLLSIAVTEIQFNFYWMGLISPDIEQLIEMDSETRVFTSIVTDILFVSSYWYCPFDS